MAIDALAISLIGSALVSGSAMAQQPTQNPPADSLYRISAAADVTVSDGSSFGAQMAYRSDGDASYVQHFPDHMMQFGIDDGSVSVWRDERQLETFPNGMGVWILSHQFHAQINRFGEINSGIIRILPYEDAGVCPCTEYRGWLAAPDMGIEGHGLVVSEATGRAHKLLVYRTGDDPVSATFDDWRRLGDHHYPYRIVVDDGESVFNFQFSSITVG